MKFAKFLRTPFWQNTYGGCFCIKNNHSVAHGFPPFTLTEKERTYITAGENNIKLEKLAQTAAFYVHDSMKSSPSEEFLGKGFLKLCSKFTGEHPCQITLCSIFSEQLFLRTLMEGYFWCKLKNISYFNTYEHMVLYLFKSITALNQFKNFSHSLYKK